MAKKTLLFLFWVNTVSSSSLNYIKVTQTCKGFPISFMDLNIDSVYQTNDTTAYYFFKSVYQPEQIVLFLDTMSYDVFKIWIEPKQDVYIKIFNCGKRKILFENPSQLNTEQYYFSVYYDYLENTFSNPRFDALLKEYLKTKIIENRKNYFSLYCADLLSYTIRHDSIKLMLGAIDSSLHKYDLYHDLVIKGNIDRTKFYKITDNIHYPVLYGPDSTTKTIKNHRPKLIFFWTSGCMYCKEIAGEILKDKARHKNIEFIAFYIGKDLKEWKSKISSYNLDQLINLSDLKGYNSEFVIKCDLKAVPSYFLIDNSGKLIGRNEGKNEYEWIRKLMELEMKK
jgi:thiol-disulfide isomerase/thioredoxin